MSKNDVRRFYQALENSTEMRRRMRVLCKDQVGTVLSYVFTYGLLGGYRIDANKIVDFAASEGYFFSIGELDEVRSEPDVARERIHNGGDAGQYSTRDEPNYYPKGF